jgi:hypothetical protein
MEVAFTNGAHLRARIRNQWIGTFNLGLRVRNHTTGLADGRDRRLDLVGTHVSNGVDGGVTECNEGLRSFLREPDADEHEDEIGSRSLVDGLGIGSFHGDVDAKTVEVLISSKT